MTSQVKFTTFIIRWKPPNFLILVIIRRLSPPLICRWHLRDIWMQLFKSFEIIIKQLLFNKNTKCQQWCWWQHYVSDMMVTVLRRWWQNDPIGDFKLRWICHYNLSKWSPSRKLSLTSTMLHRHQHECPTQIQYLIFRLKKPQLRCSMWKAKFSGDSPRHGVPCWQNG